MKLIDRSSSEFLGIETSAAKAWHNKTRMATSSVKVLITALSRDFTASLLLMSVCFAHVILAYLVILSCSERDHNEAHALNEQEHF